MTDDMAPLTQRPAAKRSLAAGGGVLVAAVALIFTSATLVGCGAGPAASDGVQTVTRQGPRSCALDPPRRGTLKLESVRDNVDVADGRWLLGIQRDANRREIDVLIYLDDHGGLQSSRLPGHSQLHDVDGDGTLHMLDLSKRRWWSVRNRGGVPSVGKPTTHASLPAYAVPRSFASSDRRALITLLGERDHSREVSRLYSVPEGRQLADAGEHVVWYAACGSKACVGQASLADPSGPQDSLIAVGDQGMVPLGPLDGPSCGVPVHWVDRGHWLYARPLAHAVSIDSVALDPPHDRTSEEVPLSGWPLDTLRKAAAAESCVTLMHSRLAARHGLLIRNGERALFLPVGADAQPQLAERLPLLEGRSVTIAPLSDAGLWVELTREIRMLPNPAGSSRRDYSLYGSLGLLARHGDDWGIAQPQELGSVHSKQLRAPANGAALSRGPFSATVVVAAGEPAHTALWTGPCP